MKGANITNPDYTNASAATTANNGSDSQIVSDDESSPAPAALPSQALLPHDVNIMFLTGLHGWIGRRTGRDSFDLGDVLSFHSHASDLAASPEKKKDLWLVLGGNFLRGGSVAGSESPPRTMGTILEKLPFDAVALGEEELWFDEEQTTLQYFKEPGGWMDWWGSKLVTTNLHWNDSTTTTTTTTTHSTTASATATATASTHQWSHWRLEGDAATILVLGFIAPPKQIESPYHEQVDLVQVLPISQVLETPEFERLIQSKDFQIVLVLLSGGDDDHEHSNGNNAADTILNKIRTICGPFVLVQFIVSPNSGTLSTRRQAWMDDKASLILSAGADLDTIGLVSIDPAATSQTATHQFLDANQTALAKALWPERSIMPLSFLEMTKTPRGKELSAFIQRVQESSGGTEILGCSPRHYFADGALDRDTSLLGFHLHRVMQSTPVVVQKIKSFLGYDLLEGIVTRNDVMAILPHDDTIVQLAHSLQGDKVNRLVAHLNEHTAAGGTFLLDNGTVETPIYATSIVPAHSVGYELYVLGREAPRVQQLLADMRVRHPLYQVMDKTVRESWIHYIQTEWPYDGRECTTPKLATSDSPTTTPTATNPVPENCGGEGGGGDENSGPAASETPSSSPQGWNNDGKEPDNPKAPPPPSSTTASLIAVALTVATIALLIRWRLGSSSSRRRSRRTNNFKDDENIINRDMMNGLELPSMPPQRPYRDDPPSYQGGGTPPPPSNAFQHHNII